MAVLAAVGGASPSPAAERWARVRSPHAEVLSDAGEECARGAARRLERLHGVLEPLLPPVGEGDEAPICVLVLGVRHAFEQLVPRGRPGHGRVEGFFQGGAERAYVVVHAPACPSDGARSWDTLDHEYAHLHLNRSLAAQPLWVAEGLAEVLSGGDLDGAVASLGAARPDRCAVAARGPKIPLAELLAAGYDSPLYTDESRTDVLYAESEALARFVAARHGLDGLRSFLAAVTEGLDPVRGFARRFGDLGAIEASLLDTPSGPLFHVPAPRGGEPAFVSDVAPEAEVDSLLGDLLLHESRPAEARRFFERALGADPTDAPAHAGLAELLRRKGRWAEAGRELRLALAARPDEPGALLRHARLTLDEAKAGGQAPSPEAEAEAVAALERALARDPDLAEAAEMLARLAPEPLSRRIPLLERSFTRDPGRPDLAVVLAALHTKRHDLAAARAVLRRGREAARDPAYRFLCGHLLSQVEEWVAVTGEALGRLVALDCREDGRLRFTLAVGGGSLALEAPSARSLFVDGPGDSRELELVCGRQDLPVRVRYLPSPKAAGDGTLLTLHVLEEGAP